MGKYRKTINLLMLAFCLLFSLNDYIHSKTIGNNSINIETSARAAGMGFAFTAIADDASAIEFNPAGLYRINKFFTSFMHLNLGFDINYEHLNGAYKFKNGAFGSSTKIHAENENRKLFSFGVIADIQYADKTNSGNRYYREALIKFEKCVIDLNNKNLDFVIQLGDFIDGYEENIKKSTSDLDRVLKVWDKLKFPKYHVVGNHCLNAGEKNLKEKLELNYFYYDFTIPAVKGWRFLVLNGNDCGYGILCKNQLEWLKEKLNQAKINNERIIIFNHFALLKSAALHHRMKEPIPVLELMDESSCVSAYFAGHNHAGGYALRNSVHHITVKGMVESRFKNSYAIVEVYDDKLNIIGYGREPDRKLPFVTGVSNK